MVQFRNRGGLLMPRNSAGNERVRRCSIAGIFAAFLGALLLPAVIVQDIYAEHAVPMTSTGLDPDLAKYAPESQDAGSLIVEGSDTMQQLMSRLAAEFRRRQPDVKIAVQGGGSSKALAEFIKPAELPGRIYADTESQNRVQLIAASREMTDTEIKQFVARHGYEPTAIPVAVDAVAIYVHKDNPLLGLTLDQADAIFSITRNRGSKVEIRQWGQLGLSSEWGKASISLYGRNRKSGTREFFMDHVLGGGEFAPNLEEQPGSASVILALSRDRLGIGYSGIGWQASTVRVVPLAEAEGAPFILPTTATIADHSYPLHRILYLYMDKSPRTSFAKAAREFLAFINSREGQEAVMKAGFFPLPATQIQKTLLALSAPPPR